MAVVVVIIVAITLPLVFMQRMLLQEGGAMCRYRARGCAQRRCDLVPGAGRLFSALRCGSRHRADPACRHYAALFRRDLGEGIALSEALTLDHYRELLEYPNVVRSMVNTLSIGIVGRARSGLLHRDRDRRSPLAVAMDARQWTIWSWCRAPCRGLVTGLAMLWVFLFFKPHNPLRETLVSVWLAYTVVWLAYGMRLGSGTLLQVAPELEEAARTMGARNAGEDRCYAPTDPVRHGGKLAAYLPHLRAANTRPVSICLRPGTEVIGSLLVSLWGTGGVDLVSALSVVNVAMIGVGLFIALRLGVRLHG